MRRSPADLEVTGVDQQKRYTRDAGGDCVQFAVEDRGRRRPRSGPAAARRRRARRRTDRRDLDGRIGSGPQGGRREKKALSGPDF